MQDGERIEKTSKKIALLRDPRLIVPQVLEKQGRLVLSKGDPMKL
jgi:hypothetical protein